MRRLVALDIPPSAAFVEALRRCHDAGDAVLPLDDRLPDPARRALLDALAPSAVVDGLGEEHPLAGGRPVEAGDAVVLATSGSTGTPKGIVLTHEAVAASAAAVNARLEVDPDADRWLSCLPLAHVGGLSVVLRALAAGVPLEIHRRFEAPATMAAARRGATLVSLVPTALRRLGEEAAAFRRIVLGGSAMPGRLPANTLATYGMTETGSGVVYDGRPLEGVEIRLAPTRPTPADGARPTSADPTGGTAGEIHLRGPMLLRAYRDGRDPKNAEGWLPTGDVGSLAPDGRLVVHGRADELVVTGGENVWPAAVEAVLAGVAGVAEVAVAGLPDPEWGQRVVAFIVPAPTGPPALEDLRAPVRDRLGPWAAPKQLVLAETLPRTPLGKIRRRELPRLAPGSPSVGR